MQELSENKHNKNFKRTFLLYSRKTETETHTTHTQNIPLSALYVRKQLRVPFVWDQEIFLPVLELAFFSSDSSPRLIPRAHQYRSSFLYRHQCVSEVGRNQVREEALANRFRPEFWYLLRSARDYFIWRIDHVCLRMAAWPKTTATLPPRHSWLKTTDSFRTNSSLQFSPF